MIEGGACRETGFFFAENLMKNTIETEFNKIM